MSMLRLSPIPLVLLALASCSIGSVSYVGYVGGTPQVAGLAIGTGGTTYNYLLGAHSAGGNRYEGTDVRLARMDPSGTLDTVVIPPSGTAEMRSVSTDPDGSAVFTLHHDGAVTEWSSDLSTATTTAGTTFWPGLGAVVATRSVAGWRACDMEALPGGGFAMTGVYWKGESGTPTVYSTLKAFVLVQVPPTPSASVPDHNGMGDDATILISTSHPELHCPRLSWDATTDQLVVLKPRTGQPAGVPGGPFVEVFSLDTSLANELHFVTDEVWALGVDAKWPVWADVTADHGFVGLARDGLDGLYADAVYMYQADGTYEDATYNDATIAVAAPKDATWQSTYGNHAWWMGLPGTSPEIGTITISL